MVFTCRGRQSWAGVGRVKGTESGTVGWGMGGTGSLEEDGRKLAHSTERFYYL